MSKQEMIEFVDKAVKNGMSKDAAIRMILQVEEDVELAFQQLVGGG
jgi:hypothetical protein